MIINESLLNNVLSNINLLSLLNQPSAENLDTIIQIHLQERQAIALEKIANSLEIISRNSK